MANKKRNKKISSDILFVKAESKKQVLNKRNLSLYKFFVERKSKIRKIFFDTFRAVFKEFPLIFKIMDEETHKKLDIQGWFAGSEIYLEKHDSSEKGNTFFLRFTLFIDVDFYVINIKGPIHFVYDLYNNKIAVDKSQLKGTGPVFEEFVKDKPNIDKIKSIYNGRYEGKIISDIDVLDEKDIRSIEADFTFGGKNVSFAGLNKEKLNLKLVTSFFDPVYDVLFSFYLPKILWGLPIMNPRFKLFKVLGKMDISTAAHIAQFGSKGFLSFYENGNSTDYMVFDLDLKNGKFILKLEPAKKKGIVWFEEDVTSYITREPDRFWTWVFCQVTIPDSKFNELIKYLNDRIISDKKYKEYVTSFMKSVVTNNTKKHLDNYIKNGAVTSALKLIFEEFKSKKCLTYKIKKFISESLKDLTGKLEKIMEYYDWK